ncbi:MAG TPA: branched-chain amino acid ABC transporter permease, partial [Anaerolineales bacterium]|nr:branched-chain amino acid ABC transporter permease [Anaerolineales bacterium]
MIQFLQIFILGISLGGVYALMASGLTLIFGVMRIVNLAHAAFIIIAAYIAYGLFATWGVDPLLSVLATMPIMFFFGVLVYRVLFARLTESARFVDSTVLITFALALVIEGVLGYFFSGIYRSTNPPYVTDTLHFGPFYFPEGQFYATVFSFIILVGLWAFLRFSRIGYAIRATMQNRMAAKTVGVNVEQISLITFGLGSALAGASGSLVAFLFTFVPAKHWEWIAILMALIVLGGLGSLLGSLVGALVLSVAAAFIGFYFGPTWSP